MKATAQHNVLHFGLAERGKIYQLEGNYKEALRHYREAIRLVQGKENGDIFFQHYSQCVMEALECSGAQNEVIDYCEKFLDFLDQKEDSDIVKNYKALIWEKLGVQYLILNEKEEAAIAFKNVQTIVGKGVQKLADEMLNWIQRGYLLTSKQIKDAQLKHYYFIVTKDKLVPEYAIDLPPNYSPF